MEALMEFPWSGNELQLETFCERMLLTTMKKTIAGDFVHFLLNELYPQTESEQEDGKTVIYQHPEAVELAGIQYNNTVETYEKIRDYKPV